MRLVMNWHVLFEMRHAACTACMYAPCSAVVHFAELLYAVRASAAVAVVIALLILAHHVMHRCDLAVIQLLTCLAWVRFFVWPAALLR